MHIFKEAFKVSFCLDLLYSRYAFEWHKDQLDLCLMYTRWEIQPVGYYPAGRESPSLSEVSWNGHLKHFSSHHCFQLSSDSDISMSYPHTNISPLPRDWQISIEFLFGFVNHMNHGLILIFSFFFPLAGIYLDVQFVSSGCTPPGFDILNEWVKTLHIILPKCLLYIWFFNLNNWEYVFKAVCYKLLKIYLSRSSLNAEWWTYHTFIQNNLSN